MRDDASDPDRDDPGTRSRVTRVDTSTPVNDHDQNVDTLLGPASGPQAGVIEQSPGVISSDVRGRPHDPQLSWLSGPSAAKFVAIVAATFDG